MKLVLSRAYPVFCYLVNTLKFASKVIDSFNYRDICETRPDVTFYLAPTTPRNRPFWFSVEQSNISHLLQLQLKLHKPRLLPLPGFPTDPSSLDTDGIHFTPIAGIAYCQHLIDHAR